MLTEVWQNLTETWCKHTRWRKIIRNTFDSALSSLANWTLQNSSGRSWERGVFHKRFVSSPPFNGSTVKISLLSANILQLHESHHLLSPCHNGEKLKSRKQRAAFCREKDVLTWARFQVGIKHKSLVTRAKVRIPIFHTTVLAVVSPAAGSWSWGEGRNPDSSVRTATPGPLRSSELKELLREQVRWSAFST